MAGDVAVVAPAGASRAQVAKCLGDAGIAVVEVDDLIAPRQFAVVVVIDEREEVAADIRARVQAWLTSTSARVVVMTPKPASWTSLARAHDGQVSVLAAPAFGWQIVDVVRAVLRADSQGD